MLSMAGCRDRSLEIPSAENVCRWIEDRRGLTGAQSTRHPEDRGAIIQEPDFPLRYWTLTFVRVTARALELVGEWRKEDGFI